jgi:hypothetical protein
MSAKRLAIRLALRPTRWLAMTGKAVGSNRPYRHLPPLC